MIRFSLVTICLSFSLCLAARQTSSGELFDRSNLVAWCIVPFDAKQRSPEERAEMVARLGLSKIAYDWREQHVPEFERELLAYQKHKIEFFAFWGVHENALALFEKYHVHPQLWVTLTPSGETRDERVKTAAETLLPVLKQAKKIGSKVGIYNHGGWGGEPENMVAVCEELKARYGIDHIGIVYNFHHGHEQLARLPEALQAMKPWLLCINLNGTSSSSVSNEEKILPLGTGSEDLKILRILSASGYSGPLGIINHTQHDAEARLLDNLDGLRWLVDQMNGKPAGEKPKYRSWREAQKAVLAETSPAEPKQVSAMESAFGSALSGGLVLDGDPRFHTLPFSVECRAKLESKEAYNILVACNPKFVSTHWELYTHVKRGTLALYLPGRGGDYDSGVDICDGKWHSLCVSVEESQVTIWIDRKKVSEIPLRPAASLNHPTEAEKIAFGRLVEGGLGCSGSLDDIRISSGVIRPRPVDLPLERMDNTLGLWSFDKPGDLTPELQASIPPPAPFTPERSPLNPSVDEHWQEAVNRERIFDFYGKQGITFLGMKPSPALIPPFPGLDGGAHGHWGNQNDQETWKDGRWAESDLGNIFSGVFRGGGITVPKGVCIRFDGRATVFDPETLSFPVTWEGGFIRLNDNRHGFMSGAPMDGTVVAKPKEHRSGRYLGFYRNGCEVVFVYESSGQTHYLNARGDSEEVLIPLTKGGPSQWPLWIETTGQIGNQKPFATDRIVLPTDNPYKTLFFLTAHDFFEDGSAAVATMTGEVWLVRGLDATLDKVRWKRFATGLHQPLGLKIIDGKIHVLGRDQITRLHDLNGDDEADYYECVTNVMKTSAGAHDFIVGLERDSQGRWYFASGNQGICRINQTNTLDVLATGLRNPNGLAFSPDGRFVTSSVQEGDWTPASSICQIELGVNDGAHFGARGPKDGQAPDPVMLSLPRGEDNSASGQAFISGEAWTTLVGSGNLVHLSSGSGSAWLVMREKMKKNWQGAAYRITGNFDSGAQCPRFHPIDGHLYVTGLLGWGTYTPDDGCFQRVRFTGGASLPIRFETRDNGIILHFDQAVEDLILSAQKTFAQTWTYHYTAAYGSPEYSLHYPDTPGHDFLEVRSVQRLGKGRAIFVEIPQLQPAGQVHLRLGTGLGIFLTIHALGDPYTDYPSYTKIPKTLHSAHPDLLTLEPLRPNPWTDGKPGRKIVVEADLGLQFVQKEIRVKAGERISLTFRNPDVLPHNWLLARPGSLQRLGDLCNRMISDPEGLARHYVPKSEDVIVWTNMTSSNKEFTIHFDAPKSKGAYPYLCTFPGHWMVMNGMMKVE